MTHWAPLQQNFSIKTTFSPNITCQDNRYYTPNAYIKKQNKVKLSKSSRKNIGSNIFPINAIRQDTSVFQIPDWTVNILHRICDPELQVYFYRMLLDKI